MFIPIALAVAWAIFCMRRLSCNVCITTATAHVHGVDYLRKNGAEFTGTMTAIIWKNDADLPYLSTQRTGWAISALPGELSAGQWRTVRERESLVLTIALAVLLFHLVMSRKIMFKMKRPHCSNLCQWVPQENTFQEYKWRTGSQHSFFNFDLQCFWFIVYLRGHCVGFRFLP